MALRRSAVRLSSLVFFLAAFSCQKRSDNPPPFAGPYPDTISVMEYNVENLFDMVDNGTEYPEFKPGADNWTFETYHIKLDNIAAVIASAGPDIAVLLEIENENAARDLAKSLKTKGRSYPYFAFGDKPNRTITIPCVLSRFPVLNCKGYAAVPGANGFSRNLLEADVCLGSDTLKVFACHWPSKKEPESFRIEQANLLKDRIAKLPSAASYVIAGDLNENYDECANFHTAGLDNTRGETGINHVLGTVTSRKGAYTDYITKRDVAKRSGMALFDPWLDITENKRMSEVYRGQNNTPDHILLPPALFYGNRLSYVDRSFSVFSWDGRLLLNGAPYRWQMRFENHRKFHRGEGYSDHLPIMLKIRKGPFCFDLSSPAVADTASFHSVSAKTGGFESGVEGWVSGATHITCARDTQGACSGKYCLKISGFTGKQNACASRALLECAKRPDSSTRFLTMAIRGRAEISFRVRTAKGDKWTYYNGEGFGPAKSAKYAAFDHATWKTVRLPLMGRAEKAPEIEFEIRVKKQTAIDLRIDNVAIKGPPNMARATMSGYSKNSLAGE